MSSRGPRSPRIGGALRRAARLTPDDWIVLGGAAVLLCAATLALRLVKVGRLLPVVRALARGRRRSELAADAERIVWLVRAAAGICVPPLSCLATPLVAFVLLRRRTLPARLVIGVTTSGGALDGHAWVDVGTAAVAARAAGGHVPLVVVDDRGWSRALAPSGPAA